MGAWFQKERFLGRAWLAKVLYLSAWGSASDDEGDDKQHEEDDKDDLGDAHGGAGDAAKAEDSGDECDDKKGEGPG